MKYGIYTASLSIGFSGADHTEDWDVREDYSEQEWEDLGEEGQDEVLREFMNDSVGQYIELTYREKE
jgi:hypothetical protein